RRGCAVAPRRGPGTGRGSAVGDAAGTPGGVGEAFGGGCVKGAEMTRVDRLREDGWTECGTCGGSGKVASSCSDQCDYEVACPDCVNGLVPPDGMVEAAAKAMYARMYARWSTRFTWPDTNEGARRTWLLLARAALVAAARWEAPGE